MSLKGSDGWEMWDVRWKERRIILLQNAYEMSSSRIDVRTKRSCMLLGMNCNVFAEIW